MTTIVGIKACKEKGVVILGSDINGTKTNWQDNRETKSEVQKIYVNDARNAALGVAGIYDEAFKSFLSDFLDGRFDLEKIINEKFFKELESLNVKRWKGITPHQDSLTGLLLAIKSEKPKLYTCWPMGKVEERDWTSIGSGSDYAIEYINEQREFIPNRISPERGIDLTISALDKASKDIYTGGLDIAVVTPDGIYDFGKEVREKMNKARNKAIEEIKSKFK